MSIPDLATLRRCVEQTAVALPDSDLEFKHMFGGIAAYARGRVFASLSNVGLALKLPPPAQADLLTHEGAKYLQYDPGSPPSKQYVTVPEPFLADTALLEPWVVQSIEYVLTLPLPKKKGKK